MTKDTITIEVNQDFYTWWQKQVYRKDQGLMYIAWAAWKACEEQKKEEKES